MTRLILAIVLLGILFSAGCTAASRPAPTSALPSPERAWTIKLTQSGGIMGLMRKIEIHSDGSCTVIDERASQTRNSRLSDAELAALAERISSIEYLPYTKQSTCADCFMYDLEISREGGIFTARVDDVSLPESGLEALITDLRKIMERELQ